MTPADWYALGVDAAREDITAARYERDAAENVDNKPTETWSRLPSRG